MKIITSIFLFSIIIFSCQETNSEKFDFPAERIVYNRNVDSLESMPFLDSLASQMDCDDSILSTDTYLDQLNDSIQFMYEQIIVRLDSIKHNPQKAQYAEQFKDVLLKSMNNYNALDDADQSILYYSYGNATMQGRSAKCFRIFLLRQRLFFLKTVFVNSYWNYDFDSFPISK